MSILEQVKSVRSHTYPIRVAVLGCTGSVGSQTLDVCRTHADKLKVTALANFSQTEKLAELSREFGASVAVAADSTAAAKLDSLNFGSAEVYCGQAALADICSRDDVDVVVIAVVGAIGMRACYEALKAQKVVAVANKEPLVVAGDLLLPMARPGYFLPVDSEHSAIYQALVGERHKDIYKLWLTCSGGPFYGMTAAELESVTLEQALKHPSWSMGSKITIDSATLMNKGFEVIEAHQLFGVEMDAIEVLIHRQSKIHSMVEFIDGQTKALLGASDMRGAIQYALSYPERWESSIDHLDYRFEPAMTFDKPDTDAFPCLELARIAGVQGGTLPCALNAANEIANEAFRNRQIRFTDIARIVEATMEACEVVLVESLEQLEEQDALSRRIALSMIGR